MTYDLKIETDDGWENVRCSGPGRMVKKDLHVVEMNNVVIKFQGTISNIKQVDEQAERQKQVNRLLSQIPETETDAILPMLIKQLQDRRKPKKQTPLIDDEDEDVG